jgi:hypothetical protein
MQPQHTFARSVLKTSTDEFKLHFRDYLKTLANDIDPNRVELIAALEWCFDRWEHWRQQFYPDADLMFPFFQSGRRGSEFGHYTTVGDSGQPSVIHIKRSYLLGTSDITVWKISQTKKLVLKAEHPDRLRFVDQTILHELVHQYLYEASPDATSYEAIEAGKNYKGHGPLFAAECNRINLILHPELGFDFVPVRHTKRSHAKVADVQRPSCAHSTHGALFWCWDPSDPDLADWQIEENRQRLKQALEFYGGAVELVEEAEAIITDFSAPFAPDCADVCHQALMGYDQTNRTDLVKLFHLSVLQQMLAADTLDGVLAEIGYSTARLNIPPACVKNERAGVVSEAGPSVSASVDSPAPSTLRDVYPISDPANSLVRLNGDIHAAGGKAALCHQRFGLRDGSSLSRHLKALQQVLTDLAAA